MLIDLVCNYFCQKVNQEENDKIIMLRSAIIGILDRFHCLVQKGFEQIEKAQGKPRKKVPFVMPQIPKNKWQKMREKRLTRQNEKNMNKLNKNSQVSVQPQSVEKIRKQLFVSEQLVRDNQLQIIYSFIQTLRSEKTSFNLPLLISVSQPSRLNSASFKAIYHYLFENKLTGIIQGITTEKYSILDGEVTLFPNIIKNAFNISNIQQFAKKLQDQILPLLSTHPRLLMRQHKQIQGILKNLRKAKTYRYQFNLEVQALLGRYRFLKQGKILINNEENLSLQQLQLSDISLLAPNAYVQQLQQAQIIKYWSCQGPQQPDCYSRYVIDLPKVIQYLKIDKNAQLTLTNYKHYLTRFQCRLFLVEEERAGESIKTMKKKLQQAEKHYDSLASKATVVRYNKSCLIKPITPQLTITHCTTLRLFAKWRSNAPQDGLSVGSMMLRFINKELISIQSALQLLLRDYDTQVTIPRNRYIIQMMTAVSEYQKLQQKLEKQEQSYKKFIFDCLFRTPKKCITPQEATTPRKQIKWTVWNKQPIPYTQSLKEKQDQNKSLQMQQLSEQDEPQVVQILDEDEDSQSEEQDEQDQSDDSDVMEVEQGGEEINHSGEEMMQVDLESEGNESDLQEIAADQFIESVNFLLDQSAILGQKPQELLQPIEQVDSSNDGDQSDSQESIIVLPQ